MEEEMLGQKIYGELVDLEKRIWADGEIYDDDKPLISNVTNFIEEYLDEFITYWEERK